MVTNAPDIPLSEKRQQLIEDRAGKLDALRNYARQLEAGEGNTETIREESRRAREEVENLNDLIAAQTAIDAAEAPPRNPEFFDRSNGNLNSKKPKPRTYNLGTHGRDHHVPLSEFSTFANVETCEMAKPKQGMGDFLVSDHYRKHFIQMLSSGDDVGGRHQLQGVIDNFNTFQTENHAPEATVVANAQDFTYGGWMTTPITFVDMVHRCCDERVFMRQLATRLQTGGAGSLGIRQHTRTPNSYRRGCVCAPPIADDVPEGTVKVLEPSPFTARLDICGDLNRHAMIDAESYFAGELARDISYGQETEFWYGSGNTAGARGPLGLLHKDTFPASQESNLSANCTQAEFIDIMCKLSVCYLNNASLSWACNKETLCCLMKLEGADGRLLWAPDGNRGLANGAIGTLLGIPINVSDFIADGAQVGDYPIILGDFSQYYIAESMMIMVERERNAALDRTTWIARGADDGMPICTDAFVRGVRV